MPDLEGGKVPSIPRSLTLALAFLPLGEPVFGG